MTESTPFPARTVITSFLSCEETLASVLRIVPWCEEHKSVWSPTLTTVIMEACAQLDSLWGYTAWMSQYVRQAKKQRRNLDIEAYFEYFGKPLGGRWVVFWGGAPAQVRPFQLWAAAAKYETLDWWDAYNKLKHDRLENQERATLSTAVHATAGLFVAILACEHCRFAIEAAGWLSASGNASHNPKALLGEESPSSKDQYVLAETTLFSHPVGWCNANVKKTDEWLGDASFRFKHWFWDYETQ